MRPLHFTAAVFSMLCCQTIVEPVVVSVKKSVNNSPKIQAAILLDVSNSMDGLIDQAKNQLWNMVSVLSKVTCNGEMPQIEIALYEYGRPENNASDGYVKQISAFTNDLDKLFAELIALNTHGGNEYCGHVMYNSLTRLNWDTLSTSYKVIFIAGNESFLQGDISFTKACAEAKKKGVVVNTIYCGAKSQGISEKWNLGAECGNGTFTNIDQNAKTLSIPTPYDDSIINLKEKLNEAYIVYGEKGKEYYKTMLQNDTAAVYNLNDPTKITQYVVVKSNRVLNTNPAWDLLDAMEKDPSIIDKVDMKTLDDSLKNKSRLQLKQIAETTLAKRRLIQNHVKELSLKQEIYLKAEKEKLKSNEPQTLESEIEVIIREQVKRVNMKIN
jgi:hypothetical protein